MATTNPNQKFAFLLTGSTSSVYIEDLKLVYTMLTEYYNYPKTNIWVVFGNTIAAADSNYFDVDAAKKLVLEGAKTISDLNTLFTAFKTAADTSSDNTMLLYFTGDGTSSPALTLNGIASSIDTTWYDNNVNNFLSGIKKAELNVVMQQSHSGDFEDTVSNTVSSSPWSFTSACTNMQTAVAGVNGNKFTEAWTAGLRLEASTGGTNSGKFADEASPVSSPNYLISLEQAKTFAAAWMNDTNQTPQYNDSGDLFLGKPDLLIRDGNHPGVGLPSNKSPDIILSYTGSGSSTDKFFQDTSGTFENKIQVKVLNIGTHPVRKYYVGVIRYDTNTAGTGEKRIDDVSLLNEVLCPIPLPNDASQPSDIPPLLFSKISEFSDIKFPTQLHETIRAKAGLETITDAELDTWDYENEYSQAQLNISYSGETDVNVIPPGTGKSGTDLKKSLLFYLQVEQTNDMKMIY